MHLIQSANYRTGCLLEKELIQRCQRGDQEAFREVFKRHQHKIFRLCYHFAAGGSDAEEITQEIFLKMYLSIGRFDLRSLINYRFWQAPFPGPELWLGPMPTVNSGGRQFFTGLFILFDPKPDWLFNFNIEFPVVQDLNGIQLGLKPRISFGIIKQLFFGS
ncbi:helix-turn-helix domain-containing protein [Acidobacteria bacterium AH-259-L09]|nr:helix-turn-helix domain-containing protein [Acidobacteria bacterium AH-259-L09]